MAMLVLCGAASAQTGARRLRIAFLSGGGLDANVRRNVVEPFVQGLRDFGYVDGQNVRIDDRWAEGRPERLPALLEELLRLNPDVLVAVGPRPAELAKDSPGSVPVVTLAVNNPVLGGLAASLARPGGKITGVSSWGGELVTRRLQMLKDLVPTARRVAVLNNPVMASSKETAELLAGLEQPLGLELKLYDVREPGEFEAVFATMARDRIAAILALADATFYAHRVRLGELCQRNRLPSIWGHRDYLADTGGLASFQSDFTAIFRRGPALVDKILKGARPGDIPFERASKLGLVVNLKAARALGITVPQAVLVSADEVIE